METVKVEMLEGGKRCHATLNFAHDPYCLQDGMSSVRNP